MSNLGKRHETGGSEAIEALWQMVLKKPQITFKDFVTTILKLGTKDSDTRIPSIAKKEFGIDFKRSN
jgi:hypothetical protein